MLNKVQLIGNLGQDPEARTTKNGTTVCNLSIATTRKWTDKKTNERMEKTEWHRVTAFGFTADHCISYLSKGRQVYVEARLEYSKYEKDGRTVYSTDLIADVVTFIGGRDSGGQGGGQSSGGQQGGGYGGGQPRNNGGQQGGGEKPYDPGNYAPAGGKSTEDDDIPF